MPDIGALVLAFPAPTYQNAFSEGNNGEIRQQSLGEVQKAMHERKKRTLKSGRSGNKVKSRKQAIAIALSQARKEGRQATAEKVFLEKMSACHCSCMALWRSEWKTLSNL